jgi:hypothetical protein
MASISGTAGIAAEGARAARRARDDSLAAALADGGMAALVEAWYAQPLWASLRAHPRRAAYFWHAWLHHLTYF